MNKQIYCNNCGKTGHYYLKCKLPIISIGIIAFKIEDNIIKYLMIRRKDSLGYIEFLRGKYSHDIAYIKSLIYEMTDNEKENLLNKDFKEIWSDLWLNDCLNYRNEEILLQEKFNTIKKGIEVNKKIWTLKQLIDECKSNWKEPEWGFPKGKRNYKEQDLDTGIREWQEETGFNINDCNMILNVMPYEETFLGSNNKAYKHKYYLAFYKGNETNYNNYQKTEVGDLDWKTYDECMKFIRPYNLEKKEIINNIDKILHKYSIIS